MVIHDDPTQRELLALMVRVAQLELRVEELGALVSLLQRSMERTR